MNQKDSVVLLEPWIAAGDRAEGLEKQLKREVGHGHPLNGRRARAVAYRQNNDDVLFALIDEPTVVAVVHLTWAPNVVSLPSPSTKFFSTIEEWIEKSMKVDHLEFDEDWSWPGTS